MKFAILKIVESSVQLMNDCNQESLTQLIGGKLFDSTDDAQSYIKEFIQPLVDEETEQLLARMEKYPNLYKYSELDIPLRVTNLLIIPAITFATVKGKTLNEAKASKP